MKKIGDIIETIENVTEREKVRKTIAACMEAVCCETENVMNFEVYDSSEKVFKKILEKMQNEYLIVIADHAKQHQSRRTIIFCNKTTEIEDEIITIEKNKKELHCIINLSKATAKYLEKAN